MTARSLLVELVIGGLVVGGPQHLSSVEFDGARGPLAFGLYSGFWFIALPRLTEPATPEPARRRP